MISDDLKTALEAELIDDEKVVQAIASLSEVELAVLAKDILKARATSFLNDLTNEQLKYVAARDSKTLDKIAEEVISEPV